jgi:hypothetical protein
MYCAQMHFFRSNICFDLIPDFDLLGFWFASAANNDPNWIYLFLLKPIFLEKFGDNLCDTSIAFPISLVVLYDMWNNLGERFFNCSINDCSNKQLFETIWLLKNKQTTLKHSTKTHDFFQYAYTAVGVRTIPNW